jgi:hypothetical protein
MTESTGRQSFGLKKSHEPVSSDNEEREYGVGSGVNSTILSETLYVIRMTESTGRQSFGVKKTHEPVCMRSRGA